MKGFSAILGLGAMLFLLVAIVSSANILFDWHLATRSSGVKFPDEWGAVVVLLAICLLTFIMALIADSEIISRRVKLTLLILIPLLSILSIIAMVIVNENRYNEFSKSADIKMDNHDYKGAILDYDRAINENRKEFYYYFRRGQAKACNGDTLSALDDFDKAIRLNPQKGFLYYYRGSLRFQLKDSVNGCNDLKIAKKLGCDDGDSQLKDCP